MKKVFLTIISLMVCWATIDAQQEVITGTVEIDGYSKITKGAFWSTRPEAKSVYYGQYPEGVEVVELKSNHFVRFAKGENNRFDINYIIFPKGEKVYIKNGNYFAAICGNRISFIQPVEKVEIREVIVEKVVEKPIYLNQNTISQDQWKTIDPQKEKISEIPPVKTKKRNLGFTIGGITFGVAGLAVLAYELLKKEPTVNENVPPHGTMSGGRAGDSTTNGTGTQNGGRSD